MSRRPQHGLRRPQHRNKAHPTVAQILTNAFFGTARRALTTIAVCCVILTVASLAPNQTAMVMDHIVHALGPTVMLALRVALTIVVMGIGIRIIRKGFSGN